MKVKDHVDVRCYSCNALCAVGYTVDDRPAFFHPMPMCSAFEKAESFPQLLDWLRLSRIRTHAS
jgi:hypothetical protein